VLKKDNAYTLVQDYSPLNTWTWDTSSSAAGIYSVRVYARNVGSLLGYEEYKTISYAIVSTAPATGATLTANVASPQVAGTSITFTAGGTGGSGSYEYQFWLKIGSGAYVMVRDYASSNTWTWDTSGSAAGMDGVQVFVRNVGSPLGYEAYKTIGYTILSTAPATGATLTANVASPQVAGTSITFTAGGTGGSGTYEYKFMLKIGSGAYVMVRDYASSNTWTWDTSGAAVGMDGVQVFVRNVGSPLGYEAYKTIGYTITN
jgi:hypothetical protein